MAVCDGGEQNLHVVESVTVLNHFIERITSMCKTFNFTFQVLEYARSVPRPKVAATGAGSKAGTVQSAPARTDGGLNDEEMMELERLAERHAREKEKTEAIRQNIESAISAR